jgi:hypothetical protein
MSISLQQLPMPPDPVLSLLLGHSQHLRKTEAVWSYMPGALPAFDVGLARNELDILRWNVY